jgi:hypothetical protein
MLCSVRSAWSINAEVAATVRQVRERRENTPPLPAGSAELMTSIHLGARPSSIVKPGRSGYGNQVQPVN